MKRRFTALIFLCIALAGSPHAWGQMTVVDTLTDLQLIQTLFGGGVNVLSVSTQFCQNAQTGQFDASNTSLGLGAGMLISTGDAGQAAGPAGPYPPAFPSQQVQGITNYQPLKAISGLGLAQNIFDACVIEFDIVPYCDTLGIRYVWASEEYPDYVNSINDAFAFWISGPGYPGALPGQNIALIPGSTLPVTINNVNANTNSAYFVNNINGPHIAYNGYTVPLLAQAVVTPCDTYHVTLAIGDAVDGIFDSAVFLEEGGIGCLSPALTISAFNTTQLGGNIAVEGCVDGTFVFVLPTTPVDTSVFHFSVSGTATPGADVSPFPDSVVFLPGQDTVWLPIQVLSDNIIEGIETLILIYSDTNLCANYIYADTATMLIIDELDVQQVQDVSLCSGTSIPLGFSGVNGHSYAWNIATGLSDDTLSNPIVSLSNPNPVADTLYYILTTTAIAGLCEYYDTVQIVVQASIQADFEADTTCFGLTTGFTDLTLTDSVSFWSWDFGNGQADSISSPTVSYAAPGLYTVQLITANSAGCLDTVLRPVLVDSLPVMDMTAAPVCFGTATQLSHSIGIGVSYAWQWGDGNLSSGAGASHSYSGPGIYIITAIAMTAQGCADTTQFAAEVYALPQAGFTAEGVCVGDSSHFANLSTAGSDPGLSYDWDFGDGNTANGVTDPAHLYTSWGSKNVVLSVIDGNGCTDQTTLEIPVFASPIADFSIDPACFGQGSRFLNSSTLPDTTRLGSSFWTFGDSRVSGDTSPVHGYLEPGIYTVGLLAVSSEGCRDSIGKEATVYPLPEVNFDFREACTLTPLDFNDRSSIVDSVTGDLLSQWRWDFGDGSTGSVANPEHSYQQYGLYPVTLWVSSDKGCVDSLTREVLSFELPEAPLLEPDTVCLGFEAFLLAQLQAPAIRVDWYREASGGVSFQSGPSLTTTPLWQAELYYVEAISDKGCSSERIPIGAGVFLAGNGELLLSDVHVRLPGASVNFEVTGIDDLVAYNWDFGDRTSSGEARPEHQYEKPGRYRIVVELVDVNGCEYVLRAEVEATELVQVHVPSGFTPNMDGLNDRWFVQTSDVTGLHVRVFDRWGSLVFESKSLDFEWNGVSLKGAPVPEGVYSYIIISTSYRGINSEKSGTITVLR